MANRRIQAPGIELNEIDRSQYNNKTDYSLPNAPVCLICGFADKGENYSTQWINTKNNFIQTYGVPTNEPERYLYNGAMEILANGGILLVNKLPYDNVSRDKFPYVDYQIGKVNKIFDHDIGQGHSMSERIDDLRQMFIDLIQTLGLDYIKCETINDMRDAVNTISRLEKIPLTVIRQIKDIDVQLHAIIDELNSHNYADIFMNDNYLTSNSEISFRKSGLIDIHQLDDFITNQQTTMRNSIKIVNISRNQFSKVNFDCVKYSLSSDPSVEYSSNDILGIVPVVVTPANALYFQQMLHHAKVDKYNPVAASAFNVVSHTPDIDVDLSAVHSNMYMKYQSVDEMDETGTFISRGFDDYSLSREFSRQFPTISYLDNAHFDNTYFKNVCVLVLKAFVDHQNKDRINFQILESFVGSLDRNEKNTDNSSRLIDNVVNKNSHYIRLFSSVDKDIIKNAKIFTGHDQPLVSTGFFESQCVKNIDYNNSIAGPLTKMMNKLNNPTTSNIDLILDAGVSNIAQYLTGGSDKTYADATLTKVSDVSRWYAVIKKFDDFCKYTRKDCMFLADSPRPFCIEGESKIVRPTKIENTIDNSITTKIKFMTGINSSYSAGYSDWFQIADEYSGDFFWIPPSVKAAGVYCYTDVYHHKWDAPAGFVRGRISNAVDVAFSPTNDEAGRIYQQQWNYAINYPIDGIILEGQKTFQKNATALDRVNVRRLMLHLEKRTVAVARRFLYEGNTEYLRQSFVDSIRPIFEDAKDNYGIIDYAIRCDDTNNTPETIDRNELHCTIAVKPVKTVEYIVLNFIVTNQSANVNEEVIK